ncbi:MAG TPA: DMT family transporter [Pyrinomonadaceae bacterium]|nr:DMT family transporter [Pyrinomonadaceae bacterium]
MTTAKKGTTATDHAMAPHLALIAVQLMFGTWPIIGKIALRSVSSTSLVGFRILGAALIFTLFKPKIRELWKLPKRVIAWLVVSSLLGVVLNQLFFVKGLSFSTAINATLLTSTIPVTTLVVSMVLGYEQARMRHFLGIALAAAGVIYLVDPWRANFSSQTTLGNIILIVSAFCYGSYLAVSRDLFRRYGALDVISWIFIVGAIITLPIAAYSWSIDSWQGISPRFWLAILYVIVVPTVGAYYLNSWAITRVPPSVVAIYIYLQPLIAFGIAPLVLGESWNSRTLVAGVLILAGVTVVTIRRRKTVVSPQS